MCAGETCQPTILPVLPAIDGVSIFVLRGFLDAIPSPVILQHRDRRHRCSRRRKLYVSILMRAGFLYMQQVRRGLEQELIAVFDRAVEPKRRDVGAEKRPIT